MRTPHIFLLTWLTAMAIVASSCTRSLADGQESWPPGLLEKCVERTIAGEPMDRFRLQIWGYAEAGFMGRLTGGQDPLPMRGYNARRPNKLRFHQLNWTVERAYEAEKKFDIGILFNGLFGGDAMMTHSRGLLEHAGHGDSDAWLDILQTYVQLWARTGERSGFEVTAGKFFSPIGFESIDSTANPLFSRSYMFYMSGPNTHTGVKVNYVFSPQLSVYVAPVEGWDVFKDNNHAWTMLTGGSLSSREQVGENPRTEFNLNFSIGPEQPHNTRDYLALIDTILTHRLTSKLSQTLNADYGVEQGSVDGHSSGWAGIAYYLTYIINEYAVPTWRFEWFRDPNGVQTPEGGTFFETTLGMCLTPLPNHRWLNNLLVRPEVRWDFGNVAVFGGGRRYQLTTGFDVIYMF